jgi:hypothetical protein
MAELSSKLLPADDLRTPATAANGTVPCNPAAEIAESGSGRRSVCRMLCLASDNDHRAVYVADEERRTVACSKARGVSPFSDRAHPLAEPSGMRHQSVAGIARKQFDSFSTAPF